MGEDHGRPHRSQSPPKDLRCSGNGWMLKGLILISILIVATDGGTVMGIRPSQFMPELTRDAFCLFLGGHGEIQPNSAIWGLDGGSHCGNSFADHRARTFSPVTDSDSEVGVRPHPRRKSACSCAVYACMPLSHRSLFSSVSTIVEFTSATFGCLPRSLQPGGPSFGPCLTTRHTRHRIACLVQLTILSPPPCRFCSCSSILAERPSGRRPAWSGLARLSSSSTSRQSTISSKRRRMTPW